MMRVRKAKSPREGAILLSVATAWSCNKAAGLKLSGRLTHQALVPGMKVHHAVFHG